MRAEKTTANADDAKVLFAGSVLAILILTLVPYGAVVWDRYFAPRPFISATVELRHDTNGAAPKIIYDADASQTVHAVWIADIKSTSHQQLQTRRGEWTYSPSIDDPRPWSWEAFFENERGSPLPRVPQIPFILCVRYIATAADSGVSHQTKSFCSKPYDPKEKANG